MPADNLLVEQVVFASAARTGPSATSSGFRRGDVSTGLAVLITVSAFTAGGGGIVYKLQQTDANFTNFDDVNVAPPPIKTVGRHWFLLYPGASGAGTRYIQALGIPLPPAFRHRVEYVAPYNSVTYELREFFLP